MRAATFHGNGRISIGARAVSEVRPGEVRVRVSTCCLCGSELRQLKAGWPVTPGHEIAGRVDQEGHALHGRAVAVYIPVFCGACPECAAGATNVCRNATDLIGWQRHGGYAEALSVPERCLLPLPDDVPLDLAPLLLDVIGTAAHGVRLAQRVAAHGPALVMGAGPVGLGALIVLQRMGLGPAHVVEPAPARARFAAEMGGTVLAPEQLSDRYPIVIEASGKDAARQLALDRVAPLGAIVQIGEAERWSVAETKAIRRKDFFYIRSFYFPMAEFEANLALFRADRERWARFIDERVGLQGLEGLFDRFGRGERIKPALSFEV
jgi:L-iditol 2-dehydrogenase